MEADGCVKLKRPRVNGIRDFPRGCGPNRNPAGSDVVTSSKDSSKCCYRSGNLPESSDCSEPYRMDMLRMAATERGFNLLAKEDGEFEMGADVAAILPTLVELERSGGANDSMSLSLVNQLKSKSPNHAIMMSSNELHEEFCQTSTGVQEFLDGLDSLEPVCGMDLRGTLEASKCELQWPPEVGYNLPTQRRSECNLPTISNESGNMKLLGSPSKPKLCTQPLSDDSIESGLVMMQFRKEQCVPDSTKQQLKFTYLKLDTPSPAESSLGLHLVEKPVHKEYIAEVEKDAVCSDLFQFWSNLTCPQHDDSSQNFQMESPNSVVGTSRKEMPIKRKKVSAIRDFPPGCGPNARNFRKEEVNDKFPYSARHGTIPKSDSDKKVIRKLYERKELPHNRLSCSKRNVQLVGRKTNLQANSQSKVRVSNNYEHGNKNKRTAARNNSFLEGVHWHVQQQPDETFIRKKVRDTLRLFQALCRKFVQEQESIGYQKLVGERGKRNRVDFRAFKLLEDKGLSLADSQQQLGRVPGIEIGDEFHYRIELRLIGLHRLPMAGIDRMEVNGRFVATSIVSSAGGYSDVMQNSNILIYEGEGGHPGFQKRKQSLPGNQKLNRGNLALKNSMEAGTPVRVIHGIREKIPVDFHGRSLATYIYDGLYVVEKYWYELGDKGFKVFKFQLRRESNQPALGWKEVMLSKQMKVRHGVRDKDISRGKEKKEIPVINTINEEVPMPFKYTTRIIYPPSYKPLPPRGCNCVGGCRDTQTCACVAKNGGEFPFNHDGAIVRAKPLVYECGPSCKCPPSCYNRVSQHGARFQLEIFKTEERGWGVRSLTSIPSGSFVCEYVGELLEDTEADKRTFDEYLFDIGRNYNEEALWKGLSDFLPTPDNNDLYEGVDCKGFTIDAANYGNVGRFINHSCSPNLYAQNVLYDHDNNGMPHIMLFAAENIPPLKELTYHYNYTIDQVHDPDGNVKKKDCKCKSAGCTGWLY